jgi:hypothetical protein
MTNKYDTQHQIRGGLGRGDQRNRLVFSQPPDDVVTGVVRYGEGVSNQ